MSPDKKQKRSALGTGLDALKERMWSLLAETNPPATDDPPLP